MENQTEEQRIKLTREELEEIQNIQNRNQDATYDLGLVETQRIMLDKKRISIENEIETLVKMDSDLSAKLFEKYGNGKIDFKTGEFVKN